MHLSAKDVLKNQQQFYTLLHSSKHFVSPNGQKHGDDDALSRVEKLSRTYNSAQHVEWLDRFTFSRTKELKREKLVEKKKYLFLNIELALFDYAVMLSSVLVNYSLTSVLTFATETIRGTTECLYKYVVHCL